ncbi:hypothetical protein HMPREF2863_09210 [Micrococcus sp. HMSC067E09]|nr:hypothetical protein HMPREF2863_09210 [Micrococcus sp. HMSC067E09]
MTRVPSARDKKPVRQLTDWFYLPLGGLALLQVPHTWEAQGPVIGVLYIVAVLALVLAVAMSNRGRFRSVLDAPPAT